MSDSPWEELEALVEAKDAAKIGELLEAWSEADRTYAVSHLSTTALAVLVDILDPEASATLLEALPVSQAADAIEEVSPESAAAILEEFASDERVDVLAEVEDEDREAILGASEPATAEEVRVLLTYAADTAGGLMHTEYLSVLDSASAGEAVDSLRASSDAVSGYAIQYLYAVDRAGKLAGVVPLRRLMLAREHVRISDIMIREPRVLKVDDTLEALYEIFEENAFLGAPVVDSEHVMLGVVERESVDDAAFESAESDHMKSLGIASGEELRSMPTFERSRRRLAWLSINIVLNLMAASVIAAYEETLQAAIALAVFLPIISDMSGCSGNQAVAVSLRELSLGVIRHGEILHVLGKEIVVGVLNGLALGTLLAGVALLWRGEPMLGVVVGMALALNTMLAVSIGGTVPLAIKRMGWDPALASGPILTTLTDVCGFFLTLSFASAVLV